MGVGFVATALALAGCAPSGPAVVALRPSWHIDPRTLDFPDFTIQVCDGLPSYVEDRTVTSPDYCPWSAKVIKIDR